MAKSPWTRRLGFGAAALTVGLAMLGHSLATTTTGGGAPVSTREIFPDPVVPKGGRLLALDITEAAEGGFQEAFSQALGAGMEVVSLPLPWDELEPSPGVFSNPLPEIANLFYPRYGLRVALGVNPIDTNNDRRPVDLSGLRWDDPVLIARFNAVLDWVFSEIPDIDLVTLNIGNEVDGLLVTPDQWAAWRTFIAATAAHAHTLRPSLEVGTKAMFEGLTSRQVEELQAVNEKTDVVMATYYPLHEDFTVRDPSVVGADLGLLASLYPGRTLALMEAGFPSGALNDSSAALQARFVRQLFRAWDLHLEIALIDFTWLTDVDPAAVEQYLRYYGVDDPRFASYLATLGLRYRNGAGRDKPAMLELRRQARARGWTVTGAVARRPGRPTARAAP